MNDGVHVSIEAIQNMEVACARFARVVVDRLPALERELRQATEALDTRCDELRREISSLHDQVSSADEDEDISWARSRLEDAEQELTSVQRRTRRLAEAGAAYTAQARKVDHLATDHAVRTREFLRGTVDDLKAYFAKTLGKASGSMSTAAVSVTSANVVASASEASLPEAGTTQAIPVSSAIGIETHDHLSDSSIKVALAAIDEVHRDGALPHVPVRGTDAEAFGYLEIKSGPRGFTVDHLGIRSSGPWPELTVVHEIGHLLDLEAIGAKGVFATTSRDPVIEGVLKTVRNSHAIRVLEQKRSKAGNSRQRAYLAYLLKDQEVWARAYAQFVAERSSNLLLKTQLLSATAAEEGRQWTQEDFAPIDAEIETMFNKLGWL
jgi:hypothetical protein